MIDLDPQTMQLIDEFIMELRRQVENKAADAFLSGISDYTDPTDPTLSTINPGSLPFTRSDLEPQDVVYGDTGLGSPGTGGNVSREDHIHELDPTAGGDLSGNLPNPIVAKIQGIPVSTVDPTLNQALLFDGTEYTPGNVTTPSAGRYRSLLYEVSGGDFTFLKDSNGNPLYALTDLE